MLGELSIEAMREENFHEVKHEVKCSKNMIIQKFVT